MRRALSIGLIGLALGYAALTLWSRGPESDTPALASGGHTPPRSSSAPVAANAALTESGVAAAPPDTTQPAFEPLGEAPVEVPPSDPARAAADQARVDRLVAAGFSPARAAEILRLETEFRLTAVYAEYSATGTVRPLTGAAQLEGAKALRKNIGDVDYERYLEANGLPTRIVVGSVTPASAAANGGLMPGDEILSYAGQRVFNSRELNALAFEAGAGDTVPTTVVRNGQTLQLFVTGGALGLTPRPAP